MNVFENQKGVPDDQLSLSMVFAAVILCVGTTLALAAWPTPGKPVGVIFAPGVTQQDAFTRIASAGGRIVDIGGLSNVVIAIGPHETFFSKLHSHGALAILDGSLTSALCLTPRIPRTDA